MTFSEGFPPLPAEEEAFEEEVYPTAFGITFTPQVSGIALAILGLLGAIYLLANFVLPAWGNYQKLREDERAKQAQVERQKSGELDAQLQEAESRLARAEALKSQALALFSTEKTLDTLLLDISRFLQARKVKLLKFQKLEPKQKDSPIEGAEVIEDGSLGAAANKKLKRQSFALEVEAPFQSTQSLLRDLERLKPFLLVRNLNSQAAQSQPVLVSPQAQVTVERGQPLTTAFTLDAIFPLTPEELAKLAPPKTSEKPSDSQKTPAEE